MTTARRDFLWNLAAIVAAVLIIVGYFVFQEYQQRQQRQACRDQGGAVVFSEHGDGWSCYLPPWVGR